MWSWKEFQDVSGTIIVTLVPLKHLCQSALWQISSLSCHIKKSWWKRHVWQLMLNIGCDMFEMFWLHILPSHLVILSAPLCSKFMSWFFFFLLPSVIRTGTKWGRAVGRWSRVTEMSRATGSGSYTFTTNPANSTKPPATTAPAVPKSPINISLGNPRSKV